MILFIRQNKIKIQKIFNKKTFIIGALFTYFIVSGFGLVSASVSSSVQDQINQINNEIEAKKNEISNLKEKQKQYQAEIAKKQEEAKTLAEQIEVFDMKIDSLKAQIKTTEEELSSTRLEVDKLTEEIEKKEIEIEKQKDYLEKILITLYESSDESPVEIVLGNNRLSDFVDKMTYVNNIQSSLKDQLTNVKILKEDLEYRKDKVEEKEAELEKLNEDLAGQKRNLDSQRESKQNLLRITKSQEAAYQEWLSKAPQIEQNMNSEINSFTNKIYNLQNSGENGNAGSGYFRHPLANSGTCVTADFGWYCPFGTCRNHYGIDLGCYTGTPIYAAASGTALTAIDGYGGLYVYIVHSDAGMATLYHHLSRFSISNGTTVSKGQLIGYSGNTGNSTGPHLHFGIKNLKTGQYENPRNYVSFGGSCW